MKRATWPPHHRQISGRHLRLSFRLFSVTTCQAQKHGAKLTKGPLSKANTCPSEGRTLRENHPGFWSRYNLLSPTGRDRARRTVLRSGPAHDDTLLLPKKTSRSLFSEYTGWRTGTLLCCFAVFACLVVELILLFSALSVSVGGFGSSLLYRGSCDKVKSLTVWLLFPLNVVATVLISCSHYVMQVMAAPDRAEVDYAHSLAASITIGGLRVRNLHFASQRRRFIWWMLILSSLPIHVFLNSAIYGSVQASNSGVLVVDEIFQSDNTWEMCNSTEFSSTKTASFTCALKQDFDTGKIVNLSPQQCLHSIQMVSRPTHPVSLS